MACTERCLIPVVVNLDLDVLPPRMTARPPPARPHIGLNPSSRFTSYSTSDWAEDDAWDSGSDEEASGSGWQTTHSRSTSSTAPKPVPKPQQNSSSSTLASSYTHVNAPSPSSYPPRAEQPPAKQGWTIITNAREGRGDEGKHAEATQYPHHDGDLIVGDFDPEEPPETSHHNAPVPKSKQRQCVVREDVDDIVKGTISCMPYLSYPPLISSQIHCILSIVNPSRARFTTMGRRSLRRPCENVQSS